MTALHFAEELAAPYGPAVPVAELVVRLNRIHHGFEAQTYDAAHAEIFEQLPGVWARMAGVAGELLRGRESLRVLDYGAGTGFAAAQVADRLKGARITCYDPSPEMLAVCQQRLGRDAEYTLDEPEGRFDLLLTNSVLHHLPDLEGFCRRAGRLAAGGVWIAGHEPNQAYYLNEECLALAARARQAWRLYRLVRPARLMEVAKRRLGFAKPAGELTARRAVEEGLFARRPPAVVIDRLVDFGVAHDRGEALSGRGLDWGRVLEWLPEGSGIRFRESYNYLGPLYSPAMERRYAGEIERLRKRYPDCGANGCAVFQVGV